MNSRRAFLKTAGTLAAGAAATGAVSATACTLVDRDEMQTADARLNATRTTGFDLPLLDALGETLLPESIGADARRAAVSAFVAWVDGYDPVAEEMHGYGYADVRYLPADPAPAWRAQLSGLDLLARRSRGRAFIDLDAPARAAVVEQALRGQRGDRLPAPLQAPHIALALLSHWASAPAAWNLALGAQVSPGTCRPLDDARRAPLPLAPEART